MTFEARQALQLHVVPKHRITVLGGVTDVLPLARLIAAANNMQLVPIDNSKSTTK